MTEEEDQSLSRPQRRLLRRIYNGRTTPIVADGRPFLTYKDAAHYLRSLTLDARDAAYAAMKETAKQEDDAKRATSLIAAPDDAETDIPPGAETP